jgi:transcriptional regulator with XRE-family HTH domain
MKDRITKFLIAEHISPTEFADKIGVQRSSISHVLTGRNYPSASFIQKMLVAFPNLNPRWLLLGEGDMLSAKIPVLEPSLFDMPVISEKPEVKEVISKKEKMISVPEMSDEVTEPSIVRGSEKMETKVKKDIPSNENDINITDNKEIDKIIVLYKDKTFTSYTPS